MSRISVCLDAAHNFLLSRDTAIEIVEQQISCIGENWNGVCEAAEASEADRNLLWARQFLNPYAFDDLGVDCSHLVDMVRQCKFGN
ncbi:MAG: hypothetical protein KAT62_07190 [Desulfuromonadales bacterium]|nr:hypothetical protein [Chloroflexota bacterium]MCK4621986.1 hypothetical protein [Desulfuromonadales bacterium]